MHLQRLRFAASTAYLWVMMILLGSIVMETVMVYPNVFADPPASLKLSMDWMAVAGPSDYFPPLGLLSWVTGTAAVALAWRLRPARWWLVGSLGMIVAEGVTSILLFWPRNDIMFNQGQALHSAEVLRQVADEFQALHWLRVIFNVAAAVAAFVAFCHVHRQFGRSGPVASAATGALAR